MSMRTGNTNTAVFGSMCALHDLPTKLYKCDEWGGEIVPETVEEENPGGTVLTIPAKYSTICGIQQTEKKIKKR